MGTARFLSALALLGALFADPAEIHDLVVVIKNEKLVLSFRMNEAFSEDIDRAIASGLPVNFRYTVELRKVRTGWINKKVATRHIYTSVIYDNLTERYSLSREVAGELNATAVVSQLYEMKHFMTTLDSLGLFDTALLEPNGEYYLRVKGVMRERNLFLFIPWDLGSGWRKTYFTYLP